MKALFVNKFTNFWPKMILLEIFTAVNLYIPFEDLKARKCFLLLFSFR